MFAAKPKGSFRPYQTPEPQPSGAVTRRAVAQRRRFSQGVDAALGLLVGRVNFPVA